MCARESDIKIGFCGDTLLINNFREGNPFEGVKGLLEDCDIVLFNLETVLCNEGIPAQKRHLLSSSIINLSYMEFGPTLVAHVANNHLLDYGETGFTNTIRILREKGIHPLGIFSGESSQSVTLDFRGFRVGFLGYGDYGFPSMLAPLRRKIIIKDVLSLREHVDILVLSLHWGYEYVAYPSPSQQSLARELLENGVDVIIGHHPHVIQGIEEHGEGIVAYSLGNLQFYLQGTPDIDQTDHGFILILTVRNRKINSREFYPVHTLKDGRVVTLKDDDRIAALNRLEELSTRINGKNVGYLFWIGKTAPVYFPEQMESWRTRFSKYGTKQYRKFIFWIARPLNMAMAIAYMFIWLKKLNKYVPSSHRKR